MTMFIIMSLLLMRDLDLNHRTAIGAAGALPLLEAIAVAGDKRAASFASYMIQVIKA